MTKKEVKEKIIKYCYLYNIEQPIKWNFKEVAKVAELINKASEVCCPFCGKYNGRGFGGVICRCETERWNDENHIMAQECGDR